MSTLNPYGKMTPAEVMREHVYCGLCGAMMREVFEPFVRFDTKTGKPSGHGQLYWRCPNFAENPRRWPIEEDCNYHDGATLRTVDSIEYLNK